MKSRLRDMGKMSREKGKRFERQVAALFKEAGYQDAHRTAQFRGNTGAAGDVEGVSGLHIECKAQERMTLYDWREQAVRDATAEGKGNIPIVIHKQNNKEVLVTLGWNDFIEIYKEWEASRNE